MSIQKMMGSALVGSIVWLVWTTGHVQTVGAAAPTCPDSVACVTVTASQGGMAVVFVPGTGNRSGKCGCKELEDESSLVCGETVTCQANYDAGVNVGAGNALWADGDCIVANAAGIAVNMIASSGCGAEHTDEMKACNGNCTTCGAQSTIVVVGCSASSCPGRTCQ